MAHPVASKRRVSHSVLHRISSTRAFALSVLDNTRMSSTGAVCLLQGLYVFYRGCMFYFKTIFECRRRGYFPHFLPVGSRDRRPEVEVKRLVSHGAWTSNVPLSQNNERVHGPLFWVLLSSR